MSKIFWLRSESKENEFRRALTPNDCSEILKKGHQVIVEDWSGSIIPTEDYKKIGCEITPSGSWIKNAPDDAVIIGLKALPDSIKSFKHTHIYFAHCYKEQEGWQDLMKKFHKGGGRIIDLEFMYDENGRRTNAFGYWAGYVGAALGALFSKTTDVEKVKSELRKLRQFSDKSKLIEYVRSNTACNGDAIVIGCNGRSGTGAIDFLEEIRWQTTGWDQTDTNKGGPFPEILNYDLFVNCVLAMKPMAPFITRELIESKNQRLNIISDVSCDPDSECNMVPLYEKATNLDEPLVQVTDGGYPLQLMAIDNLPSILPKESSFDFSSQLAPYIINFNEEAGPIKTSLDVFEKVGKPLLV
jgi:saccharopine dehydrogenase (NAD+, L-lysine-forming)